MSMPKHMQPWNIRASLRRKRALVHCSQVANAVAAQDVKLSALSRAQLTRLLKGEEVGGRETRATKTAVSIFSQLGASAWQLGLV